MTKTKRILLDLGIGLLIILSWVVGNHLYIDHNNLHELVRVEAAKRAAQVK